MYKFRKALKLCPPFSNVKTVLRVFTSLWILHAVDLEAVYDITRVDFPVNCDTGAGGWAWLLRLQRGPLRHWHTDEETCTIHNCCIHALKMRLIVWKKCLFQIYLGSPCAARGESWRCFPWHSPRTPAVPWDPAPVTWLCPELHWAWPHDRISFSLWPQSHFIFISWV